MGTEGLSSSHVLNSCSWIRRVNTKSIRCRAPRHALLTICFILAASLGTSRAKSYGETLFQETWQTTCYTCMNVSNNEECNRYAIDRPCPEGRDYCLTLHVMEGRNPERSLLVNKRCASLEDCIQEATGCITSYEQTQCVSCCDQPYCNDYVPSNDTNAVFQRSAATTVIPAWSIWPPVVILSLWVLTNC